MGVQLCVEMVGMPSICVMVQQVSWKATVTIHPLICVSLYH